MKRNTLTTSIIFISILFCLAIGNAGCHIYSFHDVGAIPDSIKTVRVNFIENRAPYVNPSLSPALTDRVKQKIVNQTRLTSTTSDNAHYDIRAYVSDYSVSTSGITSVNGKSQSSINRLTVTVHVSLTNTLSGNPPTEFDISRNFDFPSSQSLESAQSGLLDQMVQNLSDDIFNRIFSNW